MDSEKDVMEQMKKGLYNQSEDNDVRISERGAKSVLGEQGPGKTVPKIQTRKS